MTSIKEAFAWAIPTEQDKIKEIWKEAILTVDTNVLLDLYRFHSSTRDSILRSLKIFSGRLWLSNQVATEFFKNRHKVIFDAKREFSNGNKSISELSNDILKLIDEKSKGNRTLPKELITSLRNNLKEKCDELIKEHVESLQSIKQLTYFEDEILIKILDLFDNSLGEPFSEKELHALYAQAEERINQKIPPGFKDDKKVDEGMYGDFLLWEQILRYGEKNDKPIILITSERKEDWWEKISGEFIGLRPELKKEAWQRLRKPILVYQTDRFLDFSEEFIAEKGNNFAGAIAEIRELNTNRNLISAAAIHKKAIKHSTKPTIVNNVQQETLYADTYTNVGFLTCTISRPTPRFTVSGHLTPELMVSPDVSVQLEKIPEPYLEFTMTPHAGTGTCYDFNIHLKSYKGLLPAGEYIFKYFAYTNSHLHLIDGDSERVVDCPECGAPYLTDVNICTDCGHEANRECKRCGVDILPSELECTPYCSYCFHQIEKLVHDD